MNSWVQLHAWAKRRKLGLYHQGGMIVLHRATGDQATLISVQTGSALAQDDGDRMARAAITAALREAPL